MTDMSLPPASVRPPIDRAAAHRRFERRRTIALTLIAAVVIGNLVVAALAARRRADGDGVAYHWFTSFDNFLLGAGRLTAFLAGYFALIEVLLLARLPFLERYVGFDRLTIWHRWNGHAVIYLALAHVVFSVWGYAKQDGTNWFQRVLAVAHPAAAARRELDPDRGGGALPSLSIDSNPTTSPYPGIITATIGTLLLVLVLVTSLVIVRRKLSLRVVVRDPLHRVRRDRARLVPHDPGRERPDRRQDTRQLAGALSSPSRSSWCSGTGSSGRSATRSASACGWPR